MSKNFFSRVARSSCSVFVPNNGNITNRINHWCKTLPRIKPYYAVKALPEASLIKVIADRSNDIGFDIASVGELKLVKKYNSPSNIIHTNPCRTPEDIKYITSHGITTFVIDNLHELIKLDKWKIPGTRIGAMVRIKSSEDSSEIKFNSKFGTSQIENIYKNWPSSIQPLGFAFHVGSRCSNPQSYINTISTIFTEHMPMAEKYGISTKIIDIGGGFSCEADITNLAYALDESCIKIPSTIKVIAEPGRYFASNYLVLYTRIKSVRQNDEGVWVLTINDSLNGSFNGIFCDKLIPVPHFIDNTGHESITVQSSDTSSQTSIKARIVGQTCDSLDVICDNLTLNSIPTENHVIRWDTMGSYTLASSAGKFNGFQDAKIWRH